MKILRNVDNKLSLILRFVVLLKSLELTHESVEPSESSLGNSRLNRSTQPLSRWLSADNRSFQSQFVSEAQPITQSLSLPTLANSPIPDPYAEPLESHINDTSIGCDLIARHSMCSCYALDSGLHIDCKITAISQMNDVLNDLKSQPIKSFSVYIINDSLNSLPERLFQNFSTLEQISISLPSLHYLSNETFNGLEKGLKSLSLVNSKLKSIPKRALNVLTNLETLDLESNVLHDIEANALNGLPLVTLDLQSNQIDSLNELSFGGLENTLVELVLIGNRLDRFPLHALQRLRRLETLKLQSNRISEIPDDGFTRFTALKNLDIQSNHLNHLDSRSFITTPKLVSLSVANNKLTVLSDPYIFEHLLDLETLDLSHNEIRAIALNNLIALRTLDLTSNHLQDIELQNVPNLKEVFISHNHIERLTNATFINSTSLSVIFLQHNSIHAIDYNTFDGLEDLLTLDLSYNQLRALDPQLLRHNTLLESLYLDNNPFHCDCRLLSLYEWFESNARLLAARDRVEDMVCSQPEKLRDSPVLSLHPVELCPVPISLMEISKLESTQVRIRWEVQNDTLVGAFTLEYYLTANRTQRLTQKYFGPFERYTDITDLKPENWYTICVQANGKYVRSVENNRPTPYVIDQSNQNKNIAEYVTSNRKCSQVRTLSHSERTLLALLTIGITISVVVFVVLMLILCLLLIAYKYRTKRRRPLNPLNSEVSEEYITYRHFSLPSSENVYS